MNHLLLDQLRPITDEEQEILNGRSHIDTSLYNMNQSMIVDRKMLLQKGKLISLRPHTRFIHFPKHRHNYVEVVYMCSGKTHHIINNEDVVLETGELLFLNQHAVQEIYPSGIDDIAVNFIILPEFFDCSLSMIGIEENAIRNFLVDCLRNDNHDVGFLHFKASDILPIQNLMENLIWMLLYPQTQKRSLTQITMGLLFMHLINFTHRINSGLNCENSLMLTVYAYIEEHYKTGSLSELSEIMGYSLHYLSHLISSVSGKTFTELMQDKRLSQAAYLLANTKLSITDIALDTGYANFSYFYKQFFNKFNCTPGDYRKSKN